MTTECIICLHVCISNSQILKSVSELNCWMPNLILQERRDDSEAISSVLDT